ncbi:centromere protein Scm3-domain-containing protein [Aspergillus granulosus]|uniref:Centromere protein Scm3-domain-containing protein n=1 Tax=Aspergillus granulosus TaxID=176169 RepID=A0ABR4HTS5_9EURO
MERLLKRRRLSLSPEPESEVEDDSGHIDLQEARAQNDLRLKSIFEGIFEKYGRDFTDVGDEIDLQTGNILVDHGHLDALDEEGNAGTIEGWLWDSEPSAPSNEQTGRSGEENVTARHHTQRTDEGGPDQAGKHSGRRVVSRLSQMLLDPKKSRETTDEGARTTSEAEDDRSSVDSLLDTALCVQGTYAQEVGMGETVTKKAISRAEESSQSQGEDNGRLDETVEPIWRVPEINVKLTTPTLMNRSIPKPIVTAVRSQSPPGAGSLWALPSQFRRNTDVVKRKKQENSPKKRKNHSPKPVVCDWSFADTPDGSESDDPLQDCEPSPTPKGAVYIREKHKDPFVASRTKNTCNYCKKNFSKESYVSHLQAVLSDPADSEHDLIDLKEELEMLTESPTLGLESKAAAYHESTPGNKHSRTTLDEAKLIIQMKMGQSMKWKEILTQFPGKNVRQLQSWYYSHWAVRQANPRLSRPWSKAELEKLERLKDKTNLTWLNIRAELPERSQAEVEFELLQLWASGDGSSTKDSSLLRPPGDE